jgi:hypothetical protein
MDIGYACVRPVLMEVSSKFHLHLMSYHVGIFDDVAPYLRRERRNEFHGDETLLTQLPTRNESWN